MIRGRAFASAARYGGKGPSAGINNNNSIKPWTFSFRAMSSSHRPSPFGALRTPKPFTDLNLIGRRFFQNGSGASSSSSASGELPFKWSSQLMAALGVFLGFGSGAAAYNFLSEDNISSFFGSPFKVSAADNKCCEEKKCEDSMCLRALECEEEIISKANCELEKALKDVKSKAVAYTEEAMKAYCAAIEAMCEFLTNGYPLIDDDELEPPEYEEAWCCLYKIAKNRCSKVKEAIQKGQCAWELLCRLREVIEAGKCCKYTSCNPLLCTAEDALNCAERELLDLKAKMDCVKSDHPLVAQYRTVIDGFRVDLKADVDRFIAENDCCVQFVEQELALQIQESYKRVVRVQKEVAQAMVCKASLPERLAKTCC